MRLRARTVLTAAVRAAAAPAERPWAALGRAIVWLMIDLHAHTTYSDGTLSPRELVELAAEIGLSAVAVTDHDSIDGLDEALAAGAELGVEVVPGSRSTWSTTA